MIILSIDPGNKNSAFVFMNEFGKIFVKGILPNLEMLSIVKNPNNYLGSPGMKCDWLAIEMIESMGMAVGKEVFETVFWIGRFIQAWSPRRWNRISRRDVKLNICGVMRAKDKNIRQALIDKIGPQGSKKDPGPTYGISKDVWSALAVGVTWFETREKWKGKK